MKLDASILTKIPANSKGHPRVCVHFLNLNTPHEKSDEFWKLHGINTIQKQYDAALRRAKRIGGKKYHNRNYGGGIAFVMSSRSEETLLDQIDAVVTLDTPKLPRNADTGSQ